MIGVAFGPYIFGIFDGLHFSVVVPTCAILYFHNVTNTKIGIFAAPDRAVLVGNLSFAFPAYILLRTLEVAFFEEDATIVAGV